MSLWTSLLSAFGWSGSSRTPGTQGGGPASGKMTTRSITPDTAMQISAVFACVRLLAETIASLPFNLFEVKAGGALVPTYTHPLYELLTKKPNRYQTNIEFFETLIYQKALHGNSYHRIDRNKEGDVISLMPYMSPQIQVKLSEEGHVTYEYYTGSGVGVFSEDTIWHNKLFGNGVIGLSPMDYARNSIGIAISSEDRVNKMANNNFKPKGILMIDKVLKPEQRSAIRDNFADLTEGGDDALRILEAGMKYEVISMNPKDVQLLESRRFQTEDICRFFNVPSVLVNDTSATTVWGSGIEQIVTGFYKFGIRPYTERVEASILNKLLQLKERRKFVPAFDYDILLRGSEKTRFETYKTAIAGGIMTLNECRKKESMMPIAGGDTLRIQQQLVPVEDNSKGGLK